MSIKVEIDVVDATTTYVGTSVTGVATSAAIWKIYKLTYSGGALTKVETPTTEGATGHTGVWDSRTGYSYG